MHTYPDNIDLSAITAPTHRHRAELLADDLARLQSLLDACRDELIEHGASDEAVAELERATEGALASAKMEANS